MAGQEARGIQRLINAFAYSKAGFQACYRHEEAFRQELLALILLLPLGFWLGDSGVERALLLGSLLLVPLTELLNSALETVVDRFGSEFHELSGRAKDIGSAAVLLSILLAAMVWGLVLLG